MVIIWYLMKIHAFNPTWNILVDLCQLEWDVQEAGLPAGSWRVGSRGPSGCKNAWHITHVRTPKQDPQNHPTVHTFTKMPNVIHYHEYIICFVFAPSCFSPLSPPLRGCRSGFVFARSPQQPHCRALLLAGTTTQHGVIGLWTRLTEHKTKWPPVCKHLECVSLYRNIEFWLHFHEVNFAFSNDDKSALVQEMACHIASISHNELNVNSLINRSTNTTKSIIMTKSVKNLIISKFRSFCDQTLITPLPHPFKNFQYHISAALTSWLSRPIMATWLGVGFVITRHHIAWTN